MFLLLTITLLVYISMIFITKHRTSIAFIGSGVLLTLGAVTSLFDASAAFSKFPSEIVILIIVLSLYTDAFHKQGLIDFIGHKFVKLTKENKVIIMIALPLLMYATSLFMNNLTVVFLYTYMALYLAIEYRLPTVPLLVSIVIGSNIGGAALPWADTPAVVLTLYTDFNLLDFLNKLFVPCIVYAVGLSLYCYIWYKYFSLKVRESPFKKMHPVDWKKLKPILILFILYIAMISVGPLINISIAYISMIFGGILLFMNKTDPMDALNELPIMDSIAFIIALFLIGGVLEYSGVLNIASQYIMSITNQNIYLIALAILFMAFTIATFLSAGPAAATLLPVCTALAPSVPFKLIYAALALGILAGSSMLPWSATGGPILLGQINRFTKHHKLKKEETSRIREIYILKSYLSFSVPFSLIMLAVSAIYIVLFISYLSPLSQ